MTDLMCFMFNVETIKGTKLEKYVELACAAARPMIYKPRQGMVGKNFSKFSAE